MTPLDTTTIRNWIGAWSKVRVHELGLKSSHIGAQNKRTERKVVLHHFSPMSRTFTLISKFTLSICGLAFCWQRHTSRKWRWRRGEGAVGRAGGNVRRRGSELCFIPSDFPSSDGVYSKKECVTEPGRPQKMRMEVLKLSRRQDKKNKKHIYNNNSL